MKMKNKFFRFLPVVLTFALIASVFSPSVFAVTPDKSWESYYNEYELDGTVSVITPGRNETEKRFTWYSSPFEGRSRLIYSENADFSDAVTEDCTFLYNLNGDRINRANAKNLKPGTTYYYKCVNGKNTAVSSSFTTIPEDGSFTAMYVTDIHMTYNEDGLDNPLMTQAYVFNEVVSDALSHGNVSHIVSAGDQASYGIKAEYAALLSSPYLKNISYAFCAGNHDTKGYEYRLIANNPNMFIPGVSSFIANDYWYVLGDALFLVFDSNNEAALTHREFIKNAIEKNPGCRWKIAVFHHDLYGRMSDSRLETAENDLRPVFATLFDEFGVDLALTGHTHYYSVTNAISDNKVADEFSDDKITNAAGTVYLVSGSVNHPRDGSGTPLKSDEKYNYFSYNTLTPIYNLIDFTSDSITVSSYELYASEPFNTFTLEKTDGFVKEGAAPDCDKAMNNILHEIKAFFTEFGISVKIIFTALDIMSKS